jgi:hypothetical protein
MTATSADREDRIAPERAERIVFSERDTLQVAELLENPVNQPLLSWPPCAASPPAG